MIVAFLAFQPWTHSQPSSDPMAGVQLFVILGGLVLMAVGYTPVLRQRRWKAQAEPATGQVVDYVLDQPVVEFDSGTGRVRFLGGGISPGPPPVGSEVPVLFDPDEPARALLAAQQGRPTVIVFIGLLVLGVGVVLFWL